MFSQLHLTLPLFPSDNLMYHYVRHGRVLTDEAREWREAVELIAVMQAKAQNWKPIEKWAIVEIELYWPDRRRRDAHNFKILLDTLGRSRRFPSGIAYRDDWRTLPRIMKIGVDKKNPRVEVTVYEADSTTHP